MPTLNARRLEASSERQQEERELHLTADLHGLTGTYLRPKTERTRPGKAGWLEEYFINLFAQRHHHRSSLVARSVRAG